MSHAGDLWLIAGLVIFIFAMPHFVAHLAVRHFAVVGLILTIVSAGMMVYGLGGIEHLSFNAISQAIYRVIGRVST